MRIRHLFPIVSLSLVLGLQASSIAQANGASIVVTPGNQQGWLIGQDAPDPLTPYAFVQGPGSPLLGTGSLMTTVASNGQKMLVGRTDYNGVLLSSLTSLSYSTYIDPTSTNVYDWYLNLYISSTGGVTKDTRLDYVPPSASKGSWQTWNALAGSWASTNGASPTTLSAFIAAHPNATIVNPFGNIGYPGLKFEAGATGTSYTGFKGAIDNITVGVSGVAKTWDFEAVGPVTSVSAVVPGSGFCGFGDNRINNDCAPITVAYCTADQGLDILGVDQGNSNGYEIIKVTKAAIDAVGIPKTNAAVLGTFKNVTLYRLISGYFQINTVRPNGKPYIIRWDACPTTTWTLVSG